MTAKTRSALQADITSSFADNTNRDITEAVLRAFLTDFTDSAMIKGTDTYEIGIAASDETSDLAVGTGKVTFRAPVNMTLTEVRSSVKTAPTGSTLVVDINKNGSSILSTKLSIDAGEKTSVTAATPAVISSTGITADDEITIDIDQVGSSVAGVGLKILLIGTRT